jgi:recombination protein RecA
MPSVGVDPSVKAVMAKIRKEYGEHAVMLGSEMVPNAETVTTGSLSFDAAMGGGWAVNHWNEILGLESAGKTMVVLKTIAANQALDPKFTTVWFASEDFHEPYAQMMGVDLSRVVVIEENVMEYVYTLAIDFIATHEVDFLVIDSYPALVPKEENKGSMEDSQVGLGARITGKFLRKSNQDMKAPLTGTGRDLTGIVINQYRDKITTYGDPRTTPGGKGKNFFYFQRVEVRREDWINNTRDDHIGQTIKMTNVKNKLAPPGRVGMVDAYFAKGNGFDAGQYDLVKDSISAAIAYEVIEKTGRMKYTFGDKEWKSGRPSMEEEIKNDEKLQQQIREAVLAKVADGPS